MNRWHDPVPGEHDAGARAWKLVRAAFETREPVPRARHRRRRVALVAIAAAAVGAGFGVAGAAIHSAFRGGANNARPTLSTLPGGGRLLLVARSGAWIVGADGSRRRLGAYDDAVWSPHGKFVAATRAHELSALDPDGGVRWTLARRGRVRLPSWNAPDGFRIAYLVDATLHVVAGNGRGDRIVARAVRATRPAWRPGPRYELAYATRSDVRVVAADTGTLVWRRRFSGATQLTWSGDGSRLLVLAPRGVRVLDARGRLVGRDDPSDATTAAAAAFVGDGDVVAEIRVHGDQCDLFLIHGGKTLFHGVGRFSGVVWSPDGQWFALAWPTADQLIFIRSQSVRKIVAFSRIASTFGSFPELRGWTPSSS